MKSVLPSLYSSQHQELFFSKPKTFQSQAAGYGPQSISCSSKRYIYIVLTPNMDSSSFPHYYTSQTELSQTGAQTDMTLGYSTIRSATKLEDVHTTLVYIL